MINIYNDLEMYVHMIIFSIENSCPQKGQKLHPEFSLIYHFYYKIKCSKVVICIIVLQNVVPFDSSKILLKSYSEVYFQIVLHRNIKTLQNNGFLNFLFWH